jgi:hypothetical protein
MTWTLKSGLEMDDVEPELIAPRPRGGLRFMPYGFCDALTPKTPFTPEERREIADAAIAGWNRWAETGTP